MTKGALSGLRVLDLSRILAGPSCTQLLGDLGAEVWKVERPARGDDTRAWGPPFARAKDAEADDAEADAEAMDAEESAYFLCANRNKRSLTIDFTTDAGRELVRRLSLEADVLVENYRVGTLAKHGLDFASLHAIHPRLVYVSITGFGQTGARREEPGYDFLAQALGGIMSLTGPEEGPPYKVGVGIADQMCGMYATVGLLAALRHRDRAGVGQHVDVSLLDTQVAWLANAGVATLMTGHAPPRLGNGHPHIVPYDVFACADGHLVIAVGNDAQLARLARVLDADWAEDPRFSTNRARVEHRDAMTAAIEARTRTWSRDQLVDALGRVAVPAGPVRELPEVLDDPHLRERGARVRVTHETLGELELLGNPLHLSETPWSARRAPPPLGAHTYEVLREVLGLHDEALVDAARRGAFGDEKRGREAGR